jgi:hypothetical protein
MTRRVILLGRSGHGGVLIAEYFLYIQYDPMGACRQRLYPIIPFEGVTLSMTEELAKLEPFRWKYARRFDRPRSGVSGGRLEGSLQYWNVLK